MMNRKVMQEPDVGIIKIYTDVVVLEQARLEMPNHGSNKVKMPR